MLNAVPERPIGQSGGRPKALAEVQDAARQHKAAALALEALVMASLRAPVIEGEAGDRTPATRQHQNRREVIE